MHWQKRILHWNENCPPYSNTKHHNKTACETFDLTVAWQNKCFCHHLVLCNVMLPVYCFLRAGAWGAAVFAVCHLAWEKSNSPLFWRKNTELPICILCTEKRRGKRWERGKSRRTTDILISIKFKNHATKDHNLQHNSAPNKSRVHCHFKWSSLNCILSHSVSLRVKKIWMRKPIWLLYFVSKKDTNIILNAYPFDYLQANETPTTRQQALPVCFVAKPLLIYKQRHPPM